MSELIKKIEYKGQEIEIYQDENSDTPNDWGNTDAFLVYEHRQFDVKRKNFEPRIIFDNICTKRKMFYNGYFVFTVYAYIHSGIALSLNKNNYPFTDQWDVSSTGFMLVQRQKGTYRRKEALKVAENVITDWNDFLSGNVYGYITKNDSCWGYYGNYETSGCLEDAKAMIDYDIEQKYGKQLELPF